MRIVGRQSAERGTKQEKEKVYLETRIKVESGVRQMEWKEIQEKEKYEKQGRLEGNTNTRTSNTASNTLTELRETASEKVKVRK